jgi:hypothetical protein
VTTLTNAIRTKIIDAAIAAAFKEREETWRKCCTSVADNMYEVTFGKDEKAVLALSNRWHTLTGTLQFRADGWRYYRQVNDNWLTHDEPQSTFALSKHRPVPYHLDTIDVGEHHPFYNTIETLRLQWHTNHKDKVELYDQLVTLTYSVRTVEKLIEAWPAGEQFVPTIEKKVAANAVVPHDLTAKINRMLGIAA